MRLARASSRKGETAPVGRGVAVAERPRSLHESLRSLQRQIGNQAVQHLLTTAALQRKAGDAAPAEERTVRSFDAVGLEIYVLAPLRRAEAKVDQQEWEAAEPHLQDAGVALIDFFEHAKARDPVMSEILIGAKNFLGVINAHVRNRAGTGGPDDAQLASMLQTTITDLQGEHLPTRPSAESDLMRPGDDEPGEAAREAPAEGTTVRLFDDVGLEIYALGPLRRALGLMELKRWAAAEAIIMPVGTALVELWEHHRSRDPVIAERLLGYKNFLGIIYTNVHYRHTSAGPSDDGLAQMVRRSVVDLEGIGRRLERAPVGSAR